MENVLGKNQYREEKYQLPILNELLLYYFLFLQLLQNSYKQTEV